MHQFSLPLPNPPRRICFLGNLPTARHLLRLSPDSLKALLAEGKDSGTRSFCSALGLHKHLASGQIQVDDYVFPELSAQDWDIIHRLTWNFPGRKESDEHRLLKGVGMVISRVIGDTAGAKVEPVHACRDRWLVPDLSFRSIRGEMVSFEAGATNPNKVRESLEGDIDHCLVFPFRSLKEENLRGYAFRRAGKAPLPPITRSALSQTLYVQTPLAA